MSCQYYSVGVDNYAGSNNINYKKTIDRIKIWCVFKVFKIIIKSLLISKNDLSIVAILWQCTWTANYCSTFVVLACKSLVFWPETDGLHFYFFRNTPVASIVIVALFLVVGILQTKKNIHQFTNSNNYLW